MAIWDAISASTPNRLVFDAGALYRDFGETSQELIGATRGGSVFTIVKEERDVEMDGTKGPIMGLRRVIQHTAKITSTLIEISENTWLDITRGTSVSDGMHNLITPDNTIVLADYFTNIALVAEVAGSSEGIIIKLLNGLVADGEVTLTVNDDDEGLIELTFAAHYDAATATVPPYTIEWPVGAS